MSTTVRPRHALGLPAGSVRSILAFGVLAYLWILALSTGTKGDRLLVELPTASAAFIYLQVLMVLIIAHFFTAHGKTIGAAVSNRSPLGLPRGSVRLLLLAGYLGLAVYMYQSGMDFQIPETGPLFLDLAILVTAFLVGHILTGLVVGVVGFVPAWFQDIQAWFALIALIILGIVVIIRLVINTSLPFEKQVNPDVVEMFLAGAVGFYFGARS